MTSRRRFLAMLGGAATVLLPRRVWPLMAGGGGELSKRLAADPLRPQFHLLPRANWMNDPCGPIFASGRYHMFFQYNPAGAYWGDMHWGHATSPDLVHWRHEPVALAPTPGGYDRAGVFSGCAVVDGGTPTVIYTGVAPPAAPADTTLRDGVHTWRETQCLAVSHDRLMTWQKAPGPVIARPPAGLAVTGFRDPCVWREGQDWMLAVGSGVRGQGGAVLLYRSPDLRHWSYLHPLLQGETSSASSLNPVDSGAMWECPDFFPLQGRHVLLISTMGKVWWRVGSYEQQRFQVEKSGITDYGAYYAARTMLDRDGNRVLWGWIPERRPESEYRAAGWAGVMSLPRVLSLDGDGRLRMEPAPPLQRLRERHMSIALGEEQSKVQTALGRLRIANLAAEIALEFTGPFQLRLLAAGDKPFAELEYRPDRRGSELRLNHASAALPVQNDHGALRLFLDGSVLELFVNKNTVITDRVYSAPNADLRVSVRGAAVKLDLWQMKPISHDRLTA